MPDAMPLQLGSVTFQDIEVPQDLALGGTQNTVVHDMPGGTRTIQTFGAFPPEKISWSGILLGANAHQRAQELDRQRVSGLAVQLTYSQWKYTVIVEKFTPVIKHAWQIDYTIECVPSEDTSAGAVAPATGPSQNGTLQNGLNQLGQKLNTPASGYQFTGQIPKQVGTLQSTIQSSMQGSSGSVANFTAAQQSSINNIASGIQSSLAPLIAGTNTAAASAALDLSSIVSVVNRITAGPPKLLTTITVNSPNLITLASVYYQDASLWGLIASTNGYLDYQLTGTVTLAIPVKPGKNPTSTTSFLQATA